MVAGKFHIFHHEDDKSLIFCNSRMPFTKSCEITHKVHFRRPTQFKVTRQKLNFQFELFKFLSDEKVYLDVGKLIQQMRTEKILPQKDLATVR